MTKNLPAYNYPVLAFLTGTSHHTGDGIGWCREGWAFMVRWESEKETCADGWSKRHYDKAMEKIDADYGHVTQWVYLTDIANISTLVESKQ